MGLLTARLAVDRIPLEAIDGEFSESKGKYMVSKNLSVCPSVTMCASSKNGEMGLL